MLANDEPENPFSRTREETRYGAHTVHTCANPSRATFPTDLTAPLVPRPLAPFARPASLSPASPAGLKNVGNTCYVNSVLQSYYCLPAFRRTVLSTALPAIGARGPGTAAELRQLGAADSDAIAKKSRNSLECTAVTSLTAISPALH